MIRSARPCRREQTLGERLLSDLGALLPPADLPVAEFLIGSLDDKGYLSIRVEDVAYELEVDVDRVRAILRMLQAEDPVGIGARTLGECLLIQIDYLAERGLTQPFAREIVSQFLSELGEHKFAIIARELKLRRPTSPPPGTSSSTSSIPIQPSGCHWTSSLQRVATTRSLSRAALNQTYSRSLAERSLGRVCNTLDGNPGLAVTPV